MEKFQTVDTATYYKGGFFINGEKIFQIKKVYVYLTEQDKDGYDGRIDFTVTDITDLRFQRIILENKDNYLTVEMFYEDKNNKHLVINKCKFIKDIELFKLDADSNKLVSSSYSLKFKSSYCKVK